MKEKDKTTEPRYSDEKRIIGEVIGSNRGPTVVVFTGIHGNEKAGVVAADQVLHRIKNDNMRFSGNLHFILGNIAALNLGVRFQDEDLNRAWTHEKMQSIQERAINLNAETKEQLEIYSIVKSILETEPGPFYFLDLHTTSSPSVPFITISDSLNNRRFSSHYSIPVVLGIEEYLEGPLLTFINDHGHIALGFEGGQHEDPESIVNCESFIWKSLVYSGCLNRDEISDFEMHDKRFSKMCCSYQFFEISFRYELYNGQPFNMREGFENFEMIKKDQLLAFNGSEEIRSDQSGRIFMPLYQDQGEDGFFILQNVSRFWLRMSKMLRTMRAHHFLRLIPGVNQDSENDFVLIVNPRIARFMAKDIFHLFGYRQQIYKDDQLHFIKRDRNRREMI